MAPTLPLPLKSLNILDLNAAHSLIKYTIQIDGQPLYFFAPPNDDTMHGTLSCLQHNKFRLGEVNFLPGDVMLDIGCNIGLLGLVVAKLFPDVKVYAFDASDIAIRAARQSAAANGLINYLAFQVAVGGTSQKGVKFFSDGKNKSCLVADGLNSSNPVPELTVDMISIDDIFDSPLLGINKVRYKKIDIEGGEYSVFKRLFESRPDIVDRIDFLHLETHDYQEFKPDELIAKVKAQWGDKVFFDT